MDVPFDTKNDADCSVIKAEGIVAVNMYQPCVTLTEGHVQFSAVGSTFVVRFCMMRGNQELL